VRVVLSSFYSLSRMSCRWSSPLLFVYGSVNSAVSQTPNYVSINDMTLRYDFLTFKLRYHESLLHIFEI